MVILSNKLTKDIEEVNDETEEVKDKSVVNDVIAKTIANVLDRNNSDNSNQKDDVFPKKCNLCTEIITEKSLMIDHIRLMHLLKTRKNSATSKPKFEVIRQKPSKCLKIIREEISKSN